MHKITPKVTVSRYRRLFKQELGFVWKIILINVFFVFVGFGALCLHLYSKSKQDEELAPIRASTKTVKFKCFNESGGYTYQTNKKSELEIP